MSGADGRQVAIIETGVANIASVRAALTRVVIESGGSRLQAAMAATYMIGYRLAMIMAGAEKGFLDHDRAVMEAMLAFKRAGCDGVLTYFAPVIARLLDKGWQG